MKRRAKEVWLDRLHRGAVLTCVAMSLYAATNVGLFLYNYYVNVKPGLIAKHKLAQMELLAEGSSDKITLKDNAPKMS